MTAIAVGPGVSASSRIWEYPVSGARPRLVFALPASGSALDLLGDGRLVLDQISPRENLRAVSLDGSVPPRWLTHGISTDRQPEFSPDGRSIAFSSGRNGRIDIWRMALDTGEERRLTEASGTTWDPTFTADGKTIFFSSNRTGHFEIWKADSDGSHPTQVTHMDLDSENPAVSADGRWVYFVAYSGKQTGTWRIHPDGTGLEIVGPNQGVPELSRDGALLATTRSDGGISIFSTASPKKEIASIPHAFAGGSAGGRYRWLGSSHTLFFVGFDAEGHAEIFAQDIGNGSTPIRPRPVAGSRSDTAAETFDVSPDGKTLVTAEQELQANIYALENVAGVKKSSTKRD
jgi:Tol biopolymer transport system component